MTAFSVVAPIYNENESTLTELIARVGAAVRSITDDFEIILVDDGSRGGWPAITRLAEQNAFVKAVRLSRNFGQHQAITAGLEVAMGDWVVVMDADLQDRPEVIPDLYKKAMEGFDVVFVARQQRPESKLYQFFASLFHRTFRFLAETDYNSQYGNFSIVSRKVVEAYRALPENFRFYGGLLRWLGFAHGEIQAQHGERFSGKSGYTLMKRVRLAASILISYSEKPLTLSIYLGFFFATLSIIMAAWILFNVMFNEGYIVQGWASLMAGIMFMGSLNLLMIGIVGTYLGRMARDVKQRPGYVVRDSVNLGKNLLAVSRPPKS